MAANLVHRLLTQSKTMEASVQLVSHNYDTSSGTLEYFVQNCASGHVTCSIKILDFVIPLGEIEKHQKFLAVIVVFSNCRSTDQLISPKLVQLLADGDDK